MLRAPGLDGETRVGMAYSPWTLAFARAHPALIDYLEIPFEQLCHDPSIRMIQDEFPLLLHCASMSIAGFIPPPRTTVEALSQEAARTLTPWIGEHLAFLSADPIGVPPNHHEPTQLSYTVTPQYSEAVLDQVAANLERLAPQLPVPLILENSPQYMVLPGSTMTMVEFIAALVKVSGVQLLLDLSHFAITANNMGDDVNAALDRFPVEQVVEVHMSGYSRQAGVWWDDHGVAAPEASFHLFDRLLDRVRPSAVTFEYNWGTGLAEADILRHIEHARIMLARK